MSVEELRLGGRRLRIWRPAHPVEVQDPYAERGDAGPIWAQTWTSGVVLAGLLARCPLHGVRVLELGCGLGLVAIAAARAGGRVTVSDRSQLALAFTALNAEENGVAVETVTPELAAGYKLPVDYGVLVAQVNQNGPAAQAGIPTGSIIVQIDNKAINHDADLADALATQAPGKKITVTVVDSQGKQETYHVTLGELPAGTS